MEALGSAGWIHGDIKPSNIFVSPQGHVTLLDLGFSRRDDEADAANDRCLMGTGYYIAPECLATAPHCDVRSDIYSLGVVLYELLAGRRPFEGKSLEELTVQHQEAMPLSLRRVAPYVPDSLAQLVHDMLAKSPLRRPQTARELIDRLAEQEIATFTERTA
jgi:serine/threonine-protein kinase